MRLLDTYCKAGGCSEGYRQAGFTDIVGVDIAPQPNYPFKFVQSDAVKYIQEHGREYDFIHASPPCQGYSWAAKRWHKEWPLLVEPTREALKASEAEWVMENVPGAPLIDPIRLCGAMFGLRVIRHRNFESSLSLTVPDHVRHHRPVNRATRDGRIVQRSWYMTVAGHGGEGFASSLSAWREAMGIDWMTKDELVEAIPPAYTEYIGKQVVRCLSKWGAK